jgi:hypothetical protein
MIDYIFETYEPIPIILKGKKKPKKQIIRVENDDIMNFFN